MSDASVGDDAPSKPEVYGERYYACSCGHIPYDRSQPHWAEFFGKIADELVRTFRPRRVFDAGCALGFLVEALWDRGVNTYGRDISKYAIANTRSDIRPFCSVGSLAEPIEGPFDLITCIEVLEHMTEEESEIAIANMTAASDRIVFSSSPTDLVEATHINVKPPIYWIEAFASHNFAPLIETTLFSITPYALAFERRDAKPSEDFLYACADIIRGRLKQADDARVIHELSVAVNTHGGALAERIVERDRLAAERDRMAAERDGMAAERDGMAAERDRVAAERDGMAAERDRAAAERERLATERNQAFDDLASAAKRSVAIQSSLHELTDANARLYGLIDQISRSRSWRLGREVERIFRRLRLTGSRSHWAADLLAQAKASSPSFDSEFYLKQYPDVAESGADPLQHYLHYGRAEGRVPSQIALERLVYETTPTGSLPDALRLSDLCDPQHEEPGHRLSDEAFFITVLTPAFNTDPRYIRELYQTLVNQSYSNWEWVVVDDGSSSTHSIAILRDLARRDPRVRFFANPVNLGISGASNIGLAAARGTHIALVDHDDLVSRHAFLAIYEAWQKAPRTQLFYTDECKLQPDGGLSDIWAKPDWSPAYLEYTMCLGHLSVYSRVFLNELGGFRSEFDGTQDFDLALRASLRGPAVAHVPIFGYIWRIIPGSAAAGTYEKSYAIERQGRAVLDYARQRHAEAMVAPAHVAGFWRIRYPLAPSPPLLSYIIPAGGGVRAIRGKPTDLVLNCVRSFESKAFYPNREYVVVHNGLTAAQTQALAAIPSVRLVAHADKTFNFSRTVNAGVAAARGEYICLLNDDIEAITERGGEELVGYLTVNPSVGAMGPKCLFEDGRIQQCGVVLLEATGPTHAGTGAQRDFGGHHLSLMCRRETYCVGAAVLVMRKAIYEELGGFREDMPLNYNDVDFSLRLRDLGYTCVVDPAVEVYHFESATKMGTAVVEQERMFLTRADTRDPYFSKWFNPESPYFQLDLKAPDRLRPFGPWLDRHIARRAAALDQTAGPKLAICMLATDQPLAILDEALRSATMQTYTEVRLVVVDGGVRDPETRQWLETLERRGIPTASNTGAHTVGVLAAALRERIDAEFVVFLQASDFISVDALQLLAANIASHPSTAVFYTDHYEVDEHSRRLHPFFKPDFDPILLSNLWYPGCLLAAKSELLWRACDAAPAEPVSSVAHQILVQCLLDGQTPQHIRELAYGRRLTAEDTGKGSPESGTDHRRAVVRLVEAGEAADLLAVERQSDGGPLLRLTAHSPIGGVKILEAQAVWGEDGCGVSGLRTAAEGAGLKWIAILQDLDSQRALRHLSAPALFDSRVNAVCGVLLDKEDLVRWSGGLFLPGGGLFDPQAGLPIAGGGYRGMLSCQRCIDVAAPVNVLIRAEAIIRVVDRFAVVDADGLMVAIGLDAAERGELVSVTPHLTAVAGHDMMPPPADRRGVVLNNPSLQDGSRWYDGRLEVERPFMMPGFG
jgi:GT2 family glycosyltransferase/SAM-dependent methyltransferase